MLFRKRRGASAPPTVTNGDNQYEISVDGVAAGRAAYVDKHDDYDDLLDPITPQARAVVRAELA